MGRYVAAKGRYWSAIILLRTRAREVVVCGRRRRPAMEDGFPEGCANCIVKDLACPVDSKDVVDDGVATVLFVIG